MILFEITNGEDNPVYQALEVANGNRQYSFIFSMVAASLAVERPFLSQTIIKALNYHAIACLHTHAGEYRPCFVKVGAHIPPDHHRVQALMDDFVNIVNRHWEQTDPVALATFVLWRINRHSPVYQRQRKNRESGQLFCSMRQGGGTPQGINYLARVNPPRSRRVR